MSDIVTTNFLVLRKTAYSESSLIVAGISPEHGQLHFMVRGGRRIGRRESPIADLFRVLNIVFRPKPGRLASWSNAELQHDFTSVATNYAAFQTACRIAKFAISNCPENDPQPRFFNAVVDALGILADNRPMSDRQTRDLLTRVAVVYLSENGLLPNDENVDTLERVDTLLNEADCRTI